jgi:flagellar protein FliL
MAVEQGLEESNEPKKKFDLGKIIGLVMIATNFAVVGGGAYLTYQNTVAHQPTVLREPAALQELKAERDSDNQKASINYTLPPFTVNLAGHPRRLVRVEMTLEMLDEEGFEEVVQLNPAARDAIVRILNAKEFRDVETIQGKLFLKDQIAVTLNQHLKTGVVKDIFFSDFVVQ